MTSKKYLRAALVASGCTAIALTGSAVAQAPAAPAQAVKKTVKPGKTCKTLTGAMVFFGEEITRSDAVKRLDEEVAAFRAKPGNEKASETSRTVECKIFIKLLNEYECTAQATLCK